MNQSDKENALFYNLFFPLTNRKAVIWIIVTGFIVYANSLFSQFLLDDYTQIVSNPLVHSIVNIPSFFTGGTFLYYNSGTHLTSTYYRPLLTTTIAILYTLFGTNTFFYHFVQVSLHISNTVLIFYFLKRIFTRNIAFLLSLLFLVHPIQVESVVYISAIEEELFMLFGMIALLLACKNKNSIQNTVLTVFFLLLSLLSKETGALFIPMIFVYKLLFNRKHLKLYTLLSIILVIFYLFLRFAVARIHFIPLPEIPIEVAPFSVRLMTIPAIIYFYITTFFFPINLITGQMWVVNSFSLWQFFFPLMIDLLFFIVCIFAGFVVWKQFKQLFIYYIFFSLWFCLGLGLNLQLFPLDFTVSDRWFYFPFIGILGMIGILLQLVIKKYARSKVAIYYVFITIIILLSVKTFARNSNWYDELTLINHDIPYVQNNAYMDSLYAGDLQLNGDYTDAIAYYKKSYAIYPSPTILYNIGDNYQSMQNYQMAAEYYQKFININQTDFSYVSLGIVLLNEKNAKQSAITSLNKAVKIYPNNDKLWLLLAIANYESGNKKLAIQQAQKAKDLNPSNESSTILHRIQDNQPIMLNS